MGIFGRSPSVDDADTDDDDVVDFDDVAEADDDDTDIDTDDPAGGPYDADGFSDDGIGRLDIGSLRLPLPDGVRIHVEMEPNGPPRAVHLLTAYGQLTVSAYAAPRTGGLWSEICSELADQLHRDGARVRRENGEWGVELVAFVANNNVLLRFIGVDGPRWMVRAVAAGAKDNSAEAARQLRDVVRETVVVRGRQPLPARTPLPITLPEELARQLRVPDS